MFRMTAVGAGAVDYLLRGSGCDHTTAERADAREPEHEHDAAGYFADAVERGEPRGVWHGRGMEALGLDARAGELASDDEVRAVFGQLRHPDSPEADPRWIGSKPRLYKDGAARLEELRAKERDRSEERDRELRRQADGSGRRSVAYFDFTFSPAKSVSVYYAASLAVGDVETAAAVRGAHDEAVQIALDYAESHIAWTRRGRHGIDRDGQRVGEFAPVAGLSAVTFSHSTSREAEPQLHTHGAVLNRGATADGHVGALDSKGFRAMKEAIGAAYERALEQLVGEATGAVFATRPDGLAREIVGVDPELCADGSTRRAQVLERVEDLVAAYRERHGAEPDAAARKAMSQAATLDTRRPKSGLAGPAAAAAWAADRRDWCVAVLDQVDEAAIAARAEAAWTDTPDMAAGDRMSAEHQVDLAAERRRAWLAAATAAGIADIQERYATWTLGNLVEAIDRHLGDAAELGVPARERAAFVEQLARDAVRADAGLDVVQLTGHEPVPVPDALRRTGPGEDGAPRFRPPNDQRYATGAHLAVEDHVVALARAVRGPVVDDPEVDERLAAVGLSTDQRAAALGVLYSDRGGAVLIGPAGAGKSRTVGALAHEWTRGTGGRVFGVATSQIATQNLEQDGLTALNTTRFLGRFAAENGEPARDQLRGYDLVVVDEAGMSSTAHLEQVARLAATAGARVVFTGDPEQLDAVGAGGLFVRLAERVDPAQRHDLDQVHRFAAAWEAAASLRLRVGDHAAIDEYADRGRLHHGTVEDMDAAAARAYLADTVAGRSSLLIVGTNNHALELSLRVRDQLVDLGIVADGPALAEVGVGDGERHPITAGDRIQARLNRYDLRVDPAVDEHGQRGEARPVTNRAVYTVLGVDEHGDVLARDERGAVAHLPAEYLHDHGALAYATTVHGAQGVTVDTAHTVLGRDAAREQAYVGLTRGREANHAWLVTEREPDEHHPERMAEEARERLAAVLDNHGAQTSASATRAAAERDLAGLAAVAARFDITSGWASRERHEAQLEQALGEADRGRLTADPGRGRLLRALREAEFAGHNSEAVLERATEGALTGTDSVADVLRARVRRVTADREPDRVVDPSDWSSRVVVGDGEASRYVAAVADAASQRQAVLGREAADRGVEWAVDALGAVPEHPDGEGPATRQRADWEARAGVAAAYRDLAHVPDEQLSLGAAPSRERELDRALWRDAVDALGQAAVDGARDWRAAPDAELYAVRERWAREQDASPRWVADELAERHDLARQYREDATLERARLGALQPDDPQAADLAERAERSSWFADHHGEAVLDLEVEHQTRRSWWESQAPQRDADAAAADELARRNLPPERVPDPREVEQERAVEEPDAPRRDDAEAAVREPEPVEQEARHGPTREDLAESVLQAQERVQVARERVAARQHEEALLLEQEEQHQRAIADEHQQQLQAEIDGPELDQGMELD